MQQTTGMRYTQAEELVARIKAEQPTITARRVFAGKGVYHVNVQLPGEPHARVLSDPDEWEEGTARSASRAVREQPTPVTIQRQPKGAPRMAITDRNLAPGTKLTAKYKGDTYTAEVVETEAGLRYRLADGQEFKSPSSAGSAVRGGKATNGWDFWSLAVDEAPSAPTEATDAPYDSLTDDNDRKVAEEEARPVAAA